MVARELPAQVVEPRSLAFGLAYLTDGTPCVALLVDDALAIRLPVESLDAFVETLATARAELARMAPMTEGEGGSGSPREW